MIKDKKLRVKYGNAGRKFVLSSFDQQEIVKKYVEEIRKILKLAWVYSNLFMANGINPFLK